MVARLTFYDRQQIAYWLRQGKKSPFIADKIRKDRTVVWREIERNSGETLPYGAEHAQAFAARRATKTNRRKLEKDRELRQYVVRKLKRKWSPDQIAGRLKHHPPPALRGATVSHEAIYDWIYDEDHGQPWLYHQLRRKHWVRRAHGSRKHHKPAIPDRVSIHDRPEDVTMNTTIGHFESDSIVGRGKRQGLSVQYLRRLQYAKLHRILGFGAEATQDALVASVEAFPAGFVKTMTFDNGTENVRHTGLKPYGIATYFCDPDSPWQTGGVENMTGLIRQYIPKGRRLETVSDDELRTIETDLNDRPRKGLTYQTPNEALNDYKSEMLH